MTREQWREKIIEECRKAGTYQSFFDDIISTLSEILEKRDSCSKLYEQKPMPIVMMVKGGAKKPCKNPALLLWLDLNERALTYWRELGLTPSGLKNLGMKADSAGRPTLNSILEDIKREQGITDTSD